MIKKTIIAIAAVAVMAPTLALADGNKHHEGRSTLSYTGPVETVTVAALLKDTRRFTEKEAIVEGKLIKQINADTFIFSDGTDEIQVEVDDDIHLPHAIDATSQVRLFGEYEGGNTPEIEVEHIQIL